MNSLNLQELLAGQGPKSLALILITVGGLTLYLVFSRFFSLLHKREAISESLAQVFRKIVKILIFVMVVLFSLQLFGVKVSSIITSLLTIAAMIAVGFIAVWSVFSNFLCSLLVILFTPYRIGDEIEITEVVGGTGLRGKVVDFNIMYTSILESGDLPDEEKALIRIPNNIFFQKAIKRWKGEERKSIEKHLLDKSLTKS
ncbi:MAG: mechanosensitive ion channel family protein [Proteobacteria bacterium]|nr:mechanosensitive ion channel family protein [Pseudomonadota bacterium]MBU1736944.1 mechanosensitive ion channel family protein [Pseudomonadota bacterium]